MRSELPIYAILYDFDRTLSPRDMQEYQFIPQLDMEAKAFWADANAFGESHEMDKVLSYMYTMIVKSREKGIPLTRQSLVDCGRNVEFFPGVTDWFSRLVAYGKSVGVAVEHYVVSSGLAEIIEGSAIGRYFTKIYASEFLYDNDGNAVFPKSAVNYTSKTQFIYRINKGVLSVANDTDLNASTPEDERRVRFMDMLYIGDGLSDVPCMKMVKAYGGSSIAVYNPSRGGPVIANDLLRHRRVDFVFPADYSENTPFELTVKGMIHKCAIENVLKATHDSQLDDAGTGQLRF